MLVLQIAELVYFGLRELEIDVGVLLEPFWFRSLGNHDAALLDAPAE